MHLLQRESLMLERCPERSFLVVHLFSACCCVSSGDSRKATRKQVLVNRCSCTHVTSISSLVERILAGTEHTSFFLCFAPPPPLADSWERRRRRDIECFAVQFHMAFL